MLADMTRVKYNKANKSKTSGSWKDQRLKAIESTKVWDEVGGVKAYKELKPTAVFDINAVQNIMK